TTVYQYVDLRMVLFKYVDQAQQLCIHSEVGAITRNRHSGILYSIVHRVECLEFATDDAQIRTEPRQSNSNGSADTSTRTCDNGSLIGEWLLLTRYRQMTPNTPTRNACSTGSCAFSNLSTWLPVTLRQQPPWYRIGRR